MIDPRAVISPKAQLGADVSVGPFAVIGPDVVIGARTTVGAHAVIEGPTHIGEDNRIFAFAAIGGAPQDKKYRGEPTRLTIGDRNVFREFCTMNRGTATGRGLTSIGSDGLFMAYTHVAHDCDIGDKVILANCATMGGHVQIGDWVQMGGLSAIHQFCKVGAHAFLAGGSVLTRDLPPYVMIAGNPAEPHAINAEGLKRRGFTPQQIRNLRTAYRILYRSGLKLGDAVVQLKELARDNTEVQPLLTFIDASTRSLVR
ncbi:MAG TPA: acyl-ACP--UDP-N-acetylglucosamine O-acyltransferase [Steroidobacteraceae bacterium]|nr:acyl-ACP--UDP-N-acetylglucosamine O-acyltransferase [Steroidobacteraceae bacterium]